MKTDAVMSGFRLGVVAFRHLGCGNRMHDGVVPILARLSESI